MPCNGHAPPRKPAPRGATIEHPVILTPTWNSKVKVGWPDAENFTADLLAHAAYVEDIDSKICQKCLKELWGCAKAKSCSSFKKAKLKDPRDKILKYFGNTELFD